MRIFATVYTYVNKAGCSIAAQLRKVRATQDAMLPNGKALRGALA